ncbi:MAG: hypothetical protein HUU55_09835 [Myxococcales bacterium]|nr:hypothetical protein [Myxococcales bacterium]
MNRRYRLLVALCGVTAFLLTGCPDDSDDSTSDTGGSDITTTDVASTDVDEQDVNPPEDTSNPDPDVKDEDVKTCQCETNADCTDAFVDLDVCKIAVCDTQTCQCVVGNQKDFALCDDGDQCTSDSVCSGGVCGGGTSKVCDDGNPCTADSCGENGTCIFEANTAACDDSNSCTSNDVCTDGKCIGAVDETACGCETDADCVALDDGNLCNGTLHCVEGACQLDSASVVVCDPSVGGACTMTECNPATGACETAAASDGSGCSDGNFCTQGDVCQSGECVGGASACDCVATSDCGIFEDGNLCNGTLVCQAGKCIVGAQTVVKCEVSSQLCKVNVCNPETGTCGETNAANGATCDDSNACTTGTKCNAGVCGGGSTTACDDNNPCTDDSCDPATGCSNANNEAACDDGSACTVDDKCSQGGCVPGAALGCDDSNPCTDDSCDPAVGCVHASNQAVCDDGNACTSGDICAENVCTGPENVVCDDSNPCTTDSCDIATGCVFTPTSGDPCDDGNFCTVDDACDNGTCGGNGFLDCDDNNSCTNDSCNPASGCVNVSGAGACDDGNPCTVNDKCQNSACVGGGLKDCNDGNPCTADACDPALGCTNTNDNLATCDDGQSCNGVDACQGGQCIGAVCTCASNADCPDNGNLCDGVPSCDLVAKTCKTTPPVVCDGSANTACMKNTCQAATGACAMANVADGAFCDDGDFCTIDDQCAGGTCGGAAVVCDDDNLCTTDSCNAASGACLFAAVANGAACVDDGDECTSEGVCLNLQCTGQENLCGDSDCCVAKEEPGCNDPACEECVCAFDAFCCDTAWDDICVGEAGVECFDSCGCEGPPVDESCCVPKEVPGCDDADCMNCVCAFDDFCCTTAWDDTCVGEATAECGDICGCELPPGGCCLPGDGGPGCADEPECEDCVCNLDAFCCDTAWDQLCANCALGIACGDPQDPSVTCGDTCICLPDEPEPDCCIAGAEPGCAIVECADCVCANDPVCCDQMWDDLCAEQAVLDCPEECNCAIPGDDCCEAHETPGCGDAVCQDCVCTLDTFCCDTAWDDICVGEAGNECGDSCSCGGPGPGGVCCTASDTPGCEDPACQDCVCTLDAFCCDTAWDDVCVEEASVDCNDACNCDGGTPPGGACCTASEDPGCEDPACQDCVCGLDPFCCDTAWDDICVEEASVDCNDDCNCDGGTGPGSACCEPGDAAGCGDATCEGCVCVVDDFCCDVAWDQTCADVALGECTESCICEPGGDGPCCAASEAPGCVDAACETCVCTLDTFCCDTSWDDICVDEATVDCGAECGCTGGGGGDSPNCTEILDCFVECTTQACADACIAAGDLASQQAFVNWFLCLDNSGCLEATTQAEFDACLQANCLEETITCVDDL